MTLACDLSTWGVEVRGSEVQYHSLLSCKSEASLHYIISLFGNLIPWMHILSLAGMVGMAE